MFFRQAMRNLKKMSPAPISYGNLKPSLDKQISHKGGLSMDAPIHGSDLCQFADIDYIRAKLGCDVLTKRVW